MSRYWSGFVAGLDPYVPGEQPQIEGLVKLNTNENPYPPSPAVLTAITEAASSQLRLYPDPESQCLKSKIASYYGVEDGNIFLGNGSDEVLAHAFNAFFRREKPILFPDISYSFYPVYANLYDIDYTAVPLADDFSIAVGDYTVENNGIVIANPNAPTGMLVSLCDIEKMLECNVDSVVLVDEAYIDFGGQSAIPLVEKYDNLLVVQTLSKSRSLAGLRLGYAIGSQSLIEGLQRVKNSFNSYPVDQLASAAAIASFEDEAYFQSVCEQITANREALVEGLNSRGFRCLASSANFVMASLPGRDAADLFMALRDRKVLVRYFDKPRISDFLRITVGAREHQQKLLAALDDIL